MPLRLVQHPQGAAVDLLQLAVRLVVQDPVVSHADADDDGGILLALQVPDAVKPLGDRLRVAIAVYQGLLRLEHIALAARIPVPHHQRLRAVQLEQQRHIAVAVAVPVGKVDALERLPRVALQRYGIGRIAVQHLRLVVIVEVGAVRVDAHQHIGVLAAAGDGAAVPDDAGNAPVPARHVAGIVGIAAAAAAGGHGQAQQQCRHQGKKSFHRSLLLFSVGPSQSSCSAMDNISSWLSSTSPNRTKMPLVTALLHTCASASGRKRILSR